MKSILSKFILLVLMASTTSLLPAQGAKVLDGVLKLRLRNSGPIIKNNEIKGYYLFYKEDRIARGEFAYQLHILDADLNMVAEKQVIGPRSFILSEGSFNGNSIMLKFYDFKNDQTILQRYGLDGTLQQEHLIPAGKYEIAIYQNNSKEEIAGTSLHAIPGEGFVHYRFVRDRKYGYVIEYYPDEGKPWSITPDPATRMIETSNFLGYSNSILLSSTLKKKSLMTRKFDNFIMGTELATGKRLFEVKMENSQYDIQVMSVVPDDAGNGLNLLGLYFKLGDNVMKDPSLGFCRVKIDETGKIVSTDLVSWAKDVSKVMDVNERGKIKGIGYVYFHNMVTDADGDIYLIGEQFKKTVSGAGVALNALNGGNTGVSNFQLTVNDLMIFHLSSDFTLKGVDIFAKSKSRVLLPGGAGLYGPQFLAAFMVQYNAFDYSFTQQSPDKSVFTVGFVDWDKEGQGRNKLVFGAVTRIDGEYALDKISLETRATSLRVQPGKPGYVVLFEYYRKAKQLEMRLEQINY